MVLPRHAVRAYAGGAPAAGPAPRRPRRAAAAAPAPPPAAVVGAHDEPRETCIFIDEYRRNVGVCLVNSEGLVFCAR